MAKIIRTLGIFKRFQLFCWIGHYSTHKTNYCKNTCDLRNLLEHWKWWTSPLKAWTSTSSSKFGASWKINWTVLLYIQGKAFGLSFRRHGITLMLKFQEIYWHYASEMCCGNCCKRWTCQIWKLKVNKTSTTHFIWYLLCSEQPSACFMNRMKLNNVLEAKKLNHFRSVRCSNNFGHHFMLASKVNQCEKQ